VLICDTTVSVFSRTPTEFLPTPTESLPDFF
jgi:hypothetical protein